MLVANAGNYILNLLLARWLSPGEFADANLMVTLMLTVTSIALALQLVAARFIGINDAIDRPDKSAQLALTLRRFALAAGLIVGAALAIGAPLWASIFRTESPWPFVILGAGMPFYLIQSVGRGVMQGRLLFRPLAATFLIEMVVRLGVALLLVGLGGGVPGATTGLSASFVATWIAVAALSGSRSGSGVRHARVDIDTAEVRRYAGFVAVLLIAQIIANNSDVLIAKASFSPTEAAEYSAIALVGRAVFFLAWSVATVVFPAVARRAAEGVSSESVLRGGIFAVIAIGAACTIGAWLLGGPILGVVMGPTYASVSAPLAAYAAVTTLFAIANLIASAQLSLGRLGASWVVLGGAVLQTILLLVWNSDIWALIQAQALAMSILLVAVLTQQFLSGAGARTAQMGEVG
jgi:O-antigen/teichoic acid export membrane protein